MLRVTQELLSDDDVMAYNSSYGTATEGKPDRKKRRGVIEKRRRDRINSSLSELKRLVPQACQKQGSTKLEKAEILQLTVEHLQLLQSRGLNGGNGDPAVLACDYRGFGFRECVAEVARYLAAVEGLEFNDPLRLRLLGHLESYNQQRDATLKANMHWNNAWGGIHQSSGAGCGGGVGNSGTAFSAHAAKLSYSISTAAGKTGIGSSLAMLPGGTNATNASHFDTSAYLAATRLGSSAIGFSSRNHGQLTAGSPVTGYLQPGHGGRLYGHNSTPY